MILILCTLHELLYLFEESATFSPRTSPVGRASAKYSLLHVTAPLLIWWRCETLWYILKIGPLDFTLPLMINFHVIAILYMLSLSYHFRRPNDLLSMFNPLTIIKTLICVRYKWCIIRSFIYLLLIVLLGLFLYSAPVTSNNQSIHSY